MKDTKHVENTPESQDEPEAEPMHLIERLKAIGIECSRLPTAAEIEQAKLIAEKNVLNKWNDFKNLPPPTSSSFRPWRLYPEVSNSEMVRRIVNGEMNDSASEW